MRNLLMLLAAAILILPVSAWSRQVATQGQQSSDAKTKKADAQAKAKDSPEKTADTQPVSADQAPQDSLAAAARRAKEQKKGAPKPVKVFTNDDIPSSGGISVTGEKTAATTDESAAPTPTANDEKAWRDKFASLRHKLDEDQAALDVMQRELGELNLQYYSDPVKAMQQQYTRSDINNKAAEIDAKKKEIEADQQAISDAEDDLRKAGGEPGWAR